ncbi:MAG TPA: hypothetical protein VGZ47_18015 [Gemmataceae bacterium]|jgi:hypothetical protein|nr:hypothetical protein [Gemmataceae bacterium]
MITRIGKIFVFINIVVSLGLLTATAVLIKERLQWDTPPGKAKGIVDEYREQIKNLADARDRAEAKWRTAEKSLEDAVQRRPVNQNWYDEQILIANKGNNKQGQPVNPPVVVFAQPLNFDRKGQNPLLVRGQNARELNYYTQTIITRQQEIKRQQDVVTDLQRQYEELGRKLDREDLNDRGVYMMQRAQRDAKERAIAEQEFIKPALANRYSELVLALKREQILSKRKAELEKVTANPE